MKSFFSIIIPLYNKEKHIKNTLNSVINQIFEDFEVIIVNDGSTDNSQAEVAHLKDERIKLFNLENQGVSNARNFGAANANSNLFVFLDADDLWKPNHLKDLKKLYQDFPNCGLYATAYESLYGSKSISSDYFEIPKQSMWSGIVENFFESSRINCIASSSSVMIPKTVYENLGGFNVKYNSGEDIDFWIRIALRHKVAFTNSVSVIINMSAENQASQSNINTRKHLDFDTFNSEIRNQSLKAYLDLNRFSLAIQHQLAGNNIEAEKLKNKIDIQNLNRKQRFLLKLNTSALKALVKTKDMLRKNGIALSAFR
jgi:glycosyltransferase involved in cell wall biosynthesis